MSEDYYIIQNSGGDTYVECISKDELLKRINAEPGDAYYTEGFINSISERDTNYWGGKTLIIKGKIAMPQPKTIVKEYDI